MSTPHKHAKVIKAWADGIIVQERIMRCGEWQEWKDVVNHNPTWWCDSCYQYRIKPKPDMISYGVFKIPKEMDHHFTMICYDYIPKALSDHALVKLIYDGETGKLKSAEVVK